MPRGQHSPLPASPGGRGGVAPPGRGGYMAGGGSRPRGGSRSLHHSERLAFLLPTNSLVVAPAQGEELGEAHATEEASGKLLLSPREREAALGRSRTLREARRGRGKDDIFNGKMDGHDEIRLSSGSNLNPAASLEGVGPASEDPSSTPEASTPQSGASPLRASPYGPTPDLAARAGSGGWEPPQREGMVSGRAEGGPGVREARPLPSSWHGFVHDLSLRSAFLQSFHPHATQTHNSFSPPPSFRPVPPSLVVNSQEL